MKNLIKNKTALATLVIVAIVIVVVAVVGVAAYVLMTQNAGNGGETPTPTPTGSPDVAGASSLKYSVTLTEGGTQTASYTFYGKNAGTANFAMRIEYNTEDGEGIFIFNKGTSKAWTYSGGQWVDISDYFQSQFDTWDNLWSGYVTSLGQWSGTGDYTYTSGNATVRIYEIQVNPTLDDALFTHSG
ncbi:MAG: hypothetical protein NWE95_03325 [Candidatus Bathyarchaeota archaeon]|nr:hypothetical protein [Candidatus Bathyarchaeota archaeon]